MEERWDHLVVLDACRYDYFERVWRSFFPDGELTKAASVGSSTVEWRDNTFVGWYDDVVYVSANPFINSSAPVFGFTGGEHFSNVIDVWENGWDDEKGTVPPGAVTKAAIRAVGKMGGKRLIVHYLQPHAPYLGLDMDSPGFPSPDVRAGLGLKGVNRRGISNAGNWLLKLFARGLNKVVYLGNHPDWRVREFFNMGPETPMDAVRRKYGKRGLARGYESNLDLVLRDVKRLLDHLSGRIVITSDHGEFLGEDERYSHAGGSTSPYLLEVPWCVVEREKKGVTDVGREDGVGAKGEDHGTEKDSDREKKIASRLRELGYME